MSASAQAMIFRKRWQDAADDSAARLARWRLQARDRRNGCFTCMMEEEGERRAAPGYGMLTGSRTGRPRTQRVRQV